MLPSSECVNELLAKIKNTSGLIKHLGFKSLKAVEDYICDNGYDDFKEIRNEVDDYIKNLKG